MRNVNQIDINSNMNIEDLVDEMEKTGVLGSGSFSKATKIVSEMFQDNKYTVLLTLAGPLVPAGLKSIIRYLIDEKYIHCLVTTGANVTHDLVESFGYRHKIGDSSIDDMHLKNKGLGRIYDICIEQKAFEKLEKEIYRILEDIPRDKRREISSYELLWEIGDRLKRNESIIKAARKQNVPIISPCLQDSILGLNLWTFSQLKPLGLNSLLDLNKLTEIMFSAKKLGAIILGGGVPKHQTLIASTLRGGFDAAIQITLDRPEGGGLSGAPLKEAISWKKVKSNKKIVTVIGDATMLFPLIILSSIRKIA
ncbi:deoxyhypusine synthase [[Eubacterium] cellulosolvens]